MQAGNVVAELAASLARRDLDIVAACVHVALGTEPQGPRPVHGEDRRGAPVVELVQKRAGATVEFENLIGQVARDEQVAVGLEEDTARIEQAAVVGRRDEVSHQRPTRAVILDDPSGGAGNEQVAVGPEGDTERKQEPTRVCRHERSHEGAAGPVVLDHGVRAAAGDEKVAVGRDRHAGREVESPASGRDEIAHVRAAAVELRDPVVGAAGDEDAAGRRDDHVLRLVQDAGVARPDANPRQRKELAEAGARHPGGDPGVVRSPKRLQIGDLVAVTVLARIEHGVPVEIERHVRLDLGVVRRAAAVAVGFAAVRNAVAVEIGVVAQLDVQVVRKAVAVAVRLALVGDAVAVVVVAVAQRDVLGIQRSVVVAVLALVGDAVAVDVVAVVVGNVVGVVDAVAVAVVGNARGSEDMRPHVRTGNGVKAKITVPVGPAARLAAVAHDRAALRDSEQIVARVDAVAVRVKRAAVVSELVRRHLNVVSEHTRNRRIAEGPDQIADQPVRRARAERLQERHASVRHVPPPGDELSYVSGDGLLEGLPVVDEIEERVFGVEQIVRRVPEANEGQLHAGVDVPQVDVADGAPELDHVGAGRVQVAEEREELVIGLQGDLDLLRDLGNGPGRLRGRRVERRAVDATEWHARRGPAVPLRDPVVRQVQRCQARVARGAALQREARSAGHLDPPRASPFREGQEHVRAGLAGDRPAEKRHAIRVEGIRGVVAPQVAHDEPGLRAGDGEPLHLEIDGRVRTERKVVDREPRTGPCGLSQGGRVHRERHRVTNDRRELKGGIRATQGPALASVKSDQARDGNREAASGNEHVLILPGPFNGR